MKKITFILATAALLTACSSKPSYTVTGIIENAADGDTVFLQAPEGRQLIKLASAVIKNGAFTFKGVQDSAVNRIITYQAAGQEPMMIDFFLENGQINANITKESVTGTPNNDAYQTVRNQVNEINKQISTIYETISNAETSEEVRTEKIKEVEALQEKMMQAMKEGVAQNITNPVGIYLLKQNFYYMSVDELAPLMPQIPAQYDNDERIALIKSNVEKMKATAVGQKFTDFAMKTPEGKDIKLSDYVGKGKVVLIDFWASWCGPCRREMPNLVEVYKKYKNKSFEIVGVSLDRNEADWKKGIEDLKITWPQMSDVKFWDCEGAKLYAVSSIPHTVLIDGEGTIIARGLHGASIEEKVAEALKK